MRVIGGSRKSLPLESVPGLKTRPTQDRIRETLFNMLQPYTPGSIFLDLFSGTGAVGIEALSRGARHCYFVERDRKAFSVIERNIAFTRFSEESSLFKEDVLQGISDIDRTLKETADIIFMDPPYHEGYEEPVLKALLLTGLLSKDTLVIIEADIGTDFSFSEELGYTIFKDKRYKTSKHVWLKRKTL